MGRYLGTVRIVNAFVNFMPFYELDRGEFFKLSIDEKRAMFPESEMLNINLYSIREDRNKFAESFSESQLYIVDLHPDFFEENYNPYTGAVNKTRYKMNIDRLASSKYGSIDKFGYYYYVSSNETSKDFTKAFMSIDNSLLQTGFQVVVETENAKCVAGPFPVSIRSIDGEKGVLTHTKDVRSNDLFIVQAYQRTYDNNEIQDISIDVDFSTTLSCRLFCVGNKEKTFFDVISDENLIKQFKSNLGSKVTVNGMLDLNDIDKAMEAYANANLKSIPASIQEERAKRIKEILSDEKSFDDNSDLICQFIAEILVSQKDSDRLSPVFEKLAEDPEFMKIVPQIKVFQNRINELKNDIETKNQEIESLDNQINERKQAEIDERLNAEHDEIRSKIDAAKDEYEKLSADVAELQGTKSSSEYLQFLKDETAYYDRAISERKIQCETIEKNIDSIFNERTEKALNLTFDGMISQKMIQAAAKWESDQQEKQYDEVISSLAKHDYAHMEKSELVDYLCNSVCSYRGNYDRNSIINIFVCIAQGFLTVFSGAPGTGKTSVCNIVAHVLGLNMPNTYAPSSIHIDANRYIDVSVERGWTSKRDFIGYYNPLTKKFDRNNSRLFDALNILHLEATRQKTNLPFMVLLDEANLSPMEYYWADFMNVCDDLNQNSSIDLGEDYRFIIPDELRFVATINNDHTTESLSPRLLDRAWVVRLPAPQVGQGKTTQLTNTNIKGVLWSDFIDAFGASDGEITGVAKEIYDSFLMKAREIGVRVSPRSDAAIRRYWITASEIMVKDESVFADPSVIALDFAISQKVLPQISGSGENMKSGLEKLKSFAQEKNLDKTAMILEDIINRGNNTMMFYQYFG